MIREALEALDTGALGVIGLVAFVVAFVLILVRVFTMSRQARDDAKRMPLEDAPPFPPMENDHER